MGGRRPDREGLLDTPARVARSYRELFTGYDVDPREYLKRTFEEVGGYDELVVLKDIRVVSFCEHHMLPVIGRAHVGYLPTNRVVGISKLARVVHGFARRLQIQEKLTAEIAEAIQDILQPAGVGVVIEAEHSCMTLRGVNTPGSNADDQPSARRGTRRSAHARGVPGHGARRLSASLRPRPCPRQEQLKMRRVNPPLANLRRRQWLRNGTFSASSTMVTAQAT